jgi:FkbM family methyltransferase|tara:strand:+ start:1640 stop:2419 length:780 start_codon:yes stop_codon:yes gene_type:complete
MKIFLDVGSHKGETLKEVIKSKYNFEKIYCFEPSKKCIKDLTKIGDKRVKILNYGLSDKNQVLKLYNSGTLGASIIHRHLSDNNNSFEKVKLVKASQWFKKNIKIQDLVIVKLNCEGSECDILEDLLDFDQFSYIYNVLITFDIREFPKLSFREIEIRKKLKKTKLNNFCFSDNIMKGKSHQNRINYWLKEIGVINKINNKITLEKLNQKKLFYYSNKSGFFFRLEIYFKKIILYQYFPIFIKNYLKKIKKMSFLSREI